MRNFQSILESKLSVTWEGALHTIVGIKVERPSMDEIILSQPFLTDKILEKFTSDVTLPRAIPIKDTNTLTSTTPEEEILNPNGPDLSFAVGFLARFAKSPSKRHWAAVQHALGYIKAWGCRSLSLKPSTSDNQMLTWDLSRLYLAFQYCGRVSGNCSSILEGVAVMD
ncbi:uncharacterized protein VP01_1154g4 [Puccinia sorghi]|uniref:Reverse transcriptase Ty1/copia-type domain-containing protein n=1 Tax=Puccinia sorghi TaxID=27349 RepID=A0A0L6VRP8_9BASI|nr:uncharacterized protein VP01_1154g4 [Puccinia sorghi]